MKKLVFTMIWLAVLAAGCGNFPLQPNNQKAFVNPTQYTSQYPNPWILYDDQLKTGGGIEIWPGNSSIPASDLNINLLSANNPHSGSYCIDGTFTNTWIAGVFIHTPDYTTILTAPPVNLSSAGYTKAIFYARASVPMTATFFAVFNEIKGGAFPNSIVPSLTTQWQQYTIPLAASSMTSVTDYFGFGYPSVTGDVYIDDISFQ